MRPKAFDLVPTPVQLGVVLPWIDARLRRWDHRLEPERLGEQSCRVAFVGAVHDQRDSQVVASEALQQRTAGWRVVRLAGVRLKPRTCLRLAAAR